MPYCTWEDLESRFGSEISELIDRDNDDSDDVGALDKAIGDADALIDGFISSKYKVPLLNVPTLINKISCDITRYNLWDNRAPEEVEKRYKDAVSFLDRIAKGTIQLPDADPNETQTAQPLMVDANERVFTMDTLADF